MRIREKRPFKARETRRATEIRALTEFDSLPANAGKPGNEQVASMDGVLHALNEIGTRLDRIERKVETAIDLAVKNAWQTLDWLDQPAETVQCIVCDYKA